MDKTRTLLLVFIVIAIAASLLAQLFLVYCRPLWRDGVLLWGVALVAMVIAIRASRQPVKASRNASSSRLQHTPNLRVVSVVGSIVLVAITSIWAVRRGSHRNFSDLLFLWLIGVLWYITAFLPSSGLAWLTGTLRRNRAQRWTGLGLLCLLTAAAFARVYRLGTIPINMGGDEGTWGVESLAMLSNGMANPFGTGWLSFPNMSLLVYGLALRVFGRTTAGIRAISAFAGTAAVFTTYLLGKELASRRVAWFAAVALAFGHFHIHYSRLAYNNIIDTLLVSSALFLLLKGMRSRKPIHFVLTGVVTGMGWYGYFGARLIGIVLAAFFLWRLLAENRFLARHWRLILALACAFIIIVMPLLFNYAAHPETLAARANQVSIIESGWLAREQQLTGAGAGRILLDQVWKAVTAFHYTLDPTFIYRPTIPLLDVLSGMFFMGGLIVTAVSWRRLGHGLMLIWFVLALGLGWVMTENPPSSQRLIIVAPLLALEIGIGLDWMATLTSRVFDASWTTPWIVGGTVLAIIMLLNLTFYFTVYTPKRVYGNPTAQVSTDLAHYLQSQSDDYVVYMHTPPFMYWEFGTLQFLVPETDGRNMPLPGDNDVPAIDPNRGMRFVFLPERIDEIDEVATQYPSGIAKPFYSTVDERLIFTIYEVAPLAP